VTVGAVESLSAPSHCMTQYGHLPVALRRGNQTTASCVSSREVSSGEKAREHPGSLVRQCVSPCLKGKQKVLGASVIHLLRMVTTVMAFQVSTAVVPCSYEGKTRNPLPSCTSMILCTGWSNFCYVFQTRSHSLRGNRGMKFYFRVS